MFYVMFADLRGKGLATVTDAPEGVDVQEYMLGKEKSVRPDDVIQMKLSLGSGGFRGHMMGECCRSFTSTY
jgi:hypothetical protein